MPVIKLRVRSVPGVRHPLAPMSFLTGMSSLTGPFIVELMATSDEFGKHLLRNLWPDGRSFAIGEDPADVPSCFWWQTVPRDVDELTSWFRIVERPKPCDPSRPYMVVNKSDIEDPEEDEEEVYEVDLRLQGVLGKHNLGPLGNWKGYVSVVYSAALVYSPCLERPKLHRRPCSGLNSTAPTIPACGHRLSIA